MKKLFFILLLVLLFPQKSLAAEKIDFFDSRIQVNTDGEVSVTEKITYDFGSEERHGIIRDVQVVFKNESDKKFETPLSVTAVTNESGVPFGYETTKSGDYVVVKIGDPNSTVSGKVTYLISYKVIGAIESFSDHDEIFWNITGNGWEVPIGMASATVELPAGVSAESATCFTGSLGAKETLCAFTSEGYRTRFSTNSPLGIGEGLSVAVSFPKGFVAIREKKVVKDFSALISLGAVAWYVIVPLLVLIYYLKFGRDPKITSAIPALFDPPKDGERRISPAEAGTIIDESADNPDITATIIDLAIRGYIKIIEEENKDDLVDSIKSALGHKDYTFAKAEDYKARDNFKPLLPHEEKLLSALFPSEKKTIVSTRSLKSGFSQKSEEVKDLIYKNLVSGGFFPSNPKTVRNVWLVIGLVSLFMTINIPFGVICILMSRAMPRKTMKGARAKVDTLGLKKFLSSQERQLTFQEKNWYMFEKLLPYAVALGVTEVWAQRFSDLSEIPQNISWYHGASIINSQAFAGSLGSLNSSVASFSTPTRSSGGFSSGFSGGGFSGGGFGGGGGGRSW